MFKGEFPFLSAVISPARKCVADTFKAEILNKNSSMKYVFFKIKNAKLTYLAKNTLNVQHF
jgi:hypothetical protein